MPQTIRDGLQERFETKRINHEEGASTDHAGEYFGPVRRAEIGVRLGVGQRLNSRCLAVPSFLVDWHGR